jgi:hypothetical protein
MTARGINYSRRMSMDPSRIPSSLLSEVITGTRKYDFESLPLKVLLSRLRIEMLLHPGQETLNRSVSDLRELFVKCSNMPSVQKDMKKLVP